MKLQLNWGWIGVAAFGCSYGLSNLFVLADDYESAVVLWFVGLYGVLGMYAALWAWQTGDGRALILWAALLALNVLTREHTGFWAEYSLGPRLWSLTLLILIAGVVWLIFRELDRDQLFERCIWAVLLVAFEGWAVVEYIGCKMLADQATTAWLVEHWGHDVSKYTCRRWLGEWIPQMDQAFAAVIILYFVGRWIHVRRTRS